MKKPIVCEGLSKDFPQELVTWANKLGVEPEMSHDAHFVILFLDSSRDVEILEKAILEGNGPENLTRALFPLEGGKRTLNNCWHVGPAAQRERELELAAPGRYVCNWATPAQLAEAYRGRSFRIYWD